MKNLRESILNAEKYLKEMGYKATAIAHYRYAWNAFANYCEETGADLSSQPFITNVIEDAFPRERFSRGRIVFLRNAIHRLLDFESRGEFPRAYTATRYVLPSCYSELFATYETYLKQKELAQKTVKGKLINAKRFLSFIADNDVTSIPQLRQHHVYSYLSSINTKTSVARSAILFFLRGFFAYLTKKLYADKSLSEMFPVILVNRNESLPSVYSSEEIKSVVNAIDENSKCSCRDRAVIMLALQLGIRAGDVRSICIKDIDWRLRILTFVQGKTNKTLQLPLPNECFFALLDYLKNERPKSDSDHVFIRSRAPYQPYASSNVFHYIITACFARACVDTSNKHNGLHSLRHSAAVNMLLSDTPYPVISGILGHESSNTTKQYLRMDVKHLRQMSLEVPNVR